MTAKEKEANDKAELITEIEILRHDANEMLAQGGVGSPELSAISKQIDELIVRYMKMIDDH